MFTRVITHFSYPVYNLFVILSCSHYFTLFTLHRGETEDNKCKDYPCQEYPERKAVGVDEPETGLVFDRVEFVDRTRERCHKKSGILSAGR